MSGNFGNSNDEVDYEVLYNKYKTKWPNDILYDEKKIEHEIPTLYAAQTFFSMRVMPNTNTMALEHIKNSDALNYIEDENLKQKIQA